MKLPRSTHRQDWQAEVKTGFSKGLRKSKGSSTKGSIGDYKDPSKGCRRLPLIVHYKKGHDG